LLRLGIRMVMVQSDASLIYNGLRQDLAKLKQ
jgi:hypothetical protein